MAGREVRWISDQYLSVETLRLRQIAATMQSLSLGECFGGRHDTRISRCAAARHGGADDQTRRVLAGKGCKPDKLMQEAFSRAVRKSAMPRSGARRARTRLRALPRPAPAPKLPG